MYDYYVSSVHQAPNEKIQKDFWNNWDVHTDEVIIVDIVADDGNSKKITYLKKSDNRIIPQYVLQEAKLREAI
jgi:hypothetical protein